jgi:hypothetical protein
MSAAPSGFRRESRAWCDALATGQRAWIDTPRPRQAIEQDQLAEDTVWSRSPSGVRHRAGGFPTGACRPSESARALAAFDALIERRAVSSPRAKQRATSAKGKSVSN